jgi:hypothetical protein
MRPPSEWDASGSFRLFTRLGKAGNFRKFKEAIGSFEKMEMTKAARGVPA